MSGRSHLASRPPAHPSSERSPRSASAPPRPRQRQPSSPSRDDAMQMQAANNGDEIDIGGEDAAALTPSTATATALRQVASAAEVTIFVASDAQFVWTLSATTSPCFEAAHGNQGHRLGLLHFSPSWPPSFAPPWHIRPTAIPCFFCAGDPTARSSRPRRTGQSSCAGRATLMRPARSCRMSRWQRRRWARRLRYLLCGLFEWRCESSLKGGDAVIPSRAPAALAFTRSRAHRGRGVCVDEAVDGRPVTLARPTPAPSVT